MMAQTKHPIEWSKLLKRLTSLVKTAVLIYGFVGILIIPGKWIYEKASFRDVAALAVPICESYVFGDGALHEYRLLGVKIIALNAVSGARVEFSGVQSALDWGVHSSGLLQSSIQDFVKSLPNGRLPDRFFTSRLPDLPEGSITTIMMIGLIDSDEICSDFSVSVITDRYEVYHGRTTFTSVREFPLFLLSPTQLIALFYLFPFALLIIYHFILFLILFLKKLRIHNASTTES